MKNYILGAALLFLSVVNAQINADKIDGLIFGKTYTTTQLNALSNPPALLLVRNSTLNAFVYYDGTEWVVFGGTGGGTITGTETAFDGWDKDASDDLTFTTNVSGIQVLNFPTTAITNVGIGGNLGNGLFFTSNGDLQLFKDNAVGGVSNMNWRLLSNNSSNRDYTFPDKSGTVAFLDDISGGSATTNAADLTSGVLANARVQESNVTQHESALSIATSQLIGTIGTGNIADENITETKLSTAVQNKLNAVDEKLGNTNQSIPNSTTRQVTLGTSSILETNDSSGRKWFGVESNAIAQSEGNGYIGENVTFREHSGTDNDIINLNFDFATGTDGILEFTPSGLTWNGGAIGGGGTDSGQGVSYVTLNTATTTLTNSNITASGTANAKRVINLVTVNDTITIPTGLTKNHPFHIELEGADSTYIKPAVGVNFRIVDSVSTIASDGLILKGGSKGITAVIRSNETVKFYGELSVYNEGSPLVWNASDYLTPNAANPKELEEANSTTGVATLSGSWTFNSVTSPAPTSGQYALEFIRVTAPGSTIISTLDLGNIGNGLSKTVSLDMWIPTGSQIIVRQSTSQGWTSADEEFVNGTNDWQTVTFPANVVTNTTPRLRIEVATAQTTAPTFYVDNVIIN